MKIVFGLLIFSIIVIFHEFGHLLLAKKNGIKVVEFAIGFGPTLFGFTFHDTKYSVKLLPFGGVCQMLGGDFDEDPNSVEEVDKAHSFYSKTVWQRMAVIFAGPFFNFILAFILSVILAAFVGYDPSSVEYVAENTSAWNEGLRAGDEIIKLNGKRTFVGRQVDSYFLYHEVKNEPLTVVYKRNGVKNTVVITPEFYQKYVLGITYYADATSAKISNLVEDSPLAKAGVKVGDIITEINGVHISSGTELRNYFDKHPLSTDEVSIGIERGDQNLTFSVVPALSYEGYAYGFTYNLYRVKLHSPIEVIKYSAVEVGYWIETTFQNLKMLVTGKLSKDDVGGVVAIVDVIATSYEETKKNGGNAGDVILQMVYITILLSANLGVMNLLPIPALDGGKLFLYIIEAIRRKPIDRKIEGIFNIIGIILLFGLMIFVCFNDISRIFFR